MTSLKRQQWRADAAKPSQLSSTLRRHTASPCRSAKLKHDKHLSLLSPAAAAVQMHLSLSGLGSSARAKAVIICWWHMPGCLLNAGPVEQLARPGLEHVLDAEHEDAFPTC